jgi:alanine-glyoxylate transaminase / serine-glyoxylate transaminase / serine-pyruvate transaminase
MPSLPDTERLLLGPGPSPVSPRVQRALGAPSLSHLDADMMAILDEMRSRLDRVFRAGPGAFSFAVSGTGSAGLETAVSNLVRPGMRVAAVVAGYFGDRLAQVCERWGASVSRVDVPWGRAADPEQLGRALRADGADLVTLIHAETSTGVLHPVADLVAVAREHGARLIVDAVTSLGGHPVDAGAWQADAVYSCSQKGLGAPSGLAPVTFSADALARGAGSQSFYFDVRLLQAYWIDRKYHHTISAPLVYALAEALAAVEEEGLEVRWARHRHHHSALASGLGAMGLELLPPEGERLWTLNAVCVPDGIDEAAVRRFLLAQFNIEIGAGLGPLAGRIWRVGLMGHGSSAQSVLVFLSALERALREQGYPVTPGAGTAAAGDALATVK